eukprot:363612_1
MGGNDAAVVLSDCVVDAVAPKLFGSSMANTGQVCCAIKRIFVHESIHDKLVEKMTECAKGAKVGDGFDEATQFGPLNNKMQFDRVDMLVEDAKKNGATIHA